MAKVSINNVNGAVNTYESENGVNLYRFLAELNLIDIFVCFLRKKESLWKNWQARLVILNYRIWVVLMPYLLRQWNFK